MCRVCRSRIRQNSGSPPEVWRLRLQKITHTPCAVTAACLLRHTECAYYLGRLAMVCLLRFGQAVERPAIHAEEPRINQRVVGVRQLDDAADDSEGE